VNEKEILKLKIQGRVLLFSEEHKRRHLGKIITLLLTYNGSQRCQAPKKDQKSTIKAQSKLENETFCAVLLGVACYTKQSNIRKPSQLLIVRSHCIMMGVKERRKIFLLLSCIMLLDTKGKSTSSIFKR